MISGFESRRTDLQPIALAAEPFLHGFRTEELLNAGGMVDRFDSHPDDGGGDLVVPSCFLPSKAIQRKPSQKKRPEIR